MEFLVVIILGPHLKCSGITLVSGYRDHSGQDLVDNTWYHIGPTLVSYKGKQPTHHTIVQAPHIYLLKNYPSVLGFSMSLPS